jgi:hypothetical protein
MHQRALILGEDSKVFEVLTTSLAMNAQLGQAVPDEHVQPGRALNSQTALAEIKKRVIDHVIWVCHLLSQGGAPGAPSSRQQGAR